MSNRRGRLWLWCGEPSTLRALHGWLTVLWALLIIPAVLWWSQSVPFLVMVSVYANVAGHFAAWQASRVEVKQDDDGEHA